MKKELRISYLELLDVGFDQMLYIINKLINHGAPIKLLRDNIFDLSSLSKDEYKILGKITRIDNWDYMRFIWEDEK